MMNNCEKIKDAIQDHLHGIGEIPYSYSISTNKNQIILTLSSGRKYIIEVRLIR